jgi:type IV pilus assembly protein PilE
MLASTMKNGRRGFTLIELMITVAVVGLLAAVAYPNYTSYIRKGKRATAQAALMDLAGRQQTYLLDRRTYLAISTDTDLTTLGFAPPSEISTDYTFRCASAACTTTAFTVTATPSAALIAKGEQTLSITEAGVKTPVATGYWGK